MRRGEARAVVSVVAALALGLTLRVWFVGHAPRIAGDSLLYGAIARNWLLQGVYGFAEQAGVATPTLIRLPGYPLFLLGCFRVFGIENYRAVLWVQTAVDLAMAVVLAETVRRWFGGRAATVALWLGCLCPFTANYVAAPLTECLTLACLVGAYAFVGRWIGGSRWALVGVGGTLAFAVLLRPEQALLAVAVVPAVLWIGLRRDGFGWKAIEPVVLVAVCVMLPLVPWTVRNWRTFHAVQPLAPRNANDPGEAVPKGFQRWYRTWGVDYVSTETVYWNYDGSPIALSDVPARAFDSAAERARTAELLDAYNVADQPTPELDAGFDALARERIGNDRLRYFAVLPMARLANMLLRPRTEMLPVDTVWWRWREHRGQSAFAAAYAALNFVYLSLGLLGLGMWLRRGPVQVVAFSMAGYVLLRCLLLLTIDNSEPRYTLEFFPMWIVGIASLAGQRGRVAERLGR